MPNTVEHRVDMHRLASGLRRAGEPVWRYHLKLGPTFHNDDLPFEERRDAVVAELKASRWYRRQPDRENSELWQAVEELEETDTIEYFDVVWDAIYDLADYERCWLDVFSSMP